MWRALIALSMLLAAPARAQEAEPQAAPISPGLELIAAASADGVFELLPGEQIIAVRHTRSGLVCRMALGNANRLLIFPQAARGEDVACDSHDGRMGVTLYATRFSFETSLAEQIEGASAAVRTRFPGARALPTPVGASTEPGMPERASARFIVTNAEGAPTYSRIDVALVRGWAIKLRYSAIGDDAEAIQAADNAADAAWREVMGDVLNSP